ncbi:MAG: type II toxin-antitoxin system RelE/ParE family toxin [Streptosporangiaceae bacterium]
MTLRQGQRPLPLPLEVPFEDVLSTRRGEYRALYTVDDRTRVVTVLAVAHRRGAYRPR